MSITGLKKYNILFLEDSVSFAQNCIKFLDIYFKNVYHSSTIKDGFELFVKNEVHMIISDIKVSDGNGLEFVSKVREVDDEIPIFVLSAHKDEEFLFKAIPLRLTGYLLKPIEFDEFTSVLKRCETILDDIYNKSITIKDGVVYNRYTKEVSVEQNPIKLTHKEYLFLELLIKNRNKSVTKSQLERTLWDDVTSEAAIKNFILRLRQKIGKDTIETSVDGYRLRF